eukprot:11199278-Lingulodinium_polyedra.AAC.1
MGRRGTGHLRRSHRGAVRWIPGPVKPPAAGSARATRPARAVARETAPAAAVAGMQYGGGARCNITGAAQ